MDIWVAGTSKKLFVRGSYAETNFQKNKVVSAKTPFFVKGPFCTLHFAFTLISNKKYCIFNLTFSN